MRICIFGAGVIGSVLAGKLAAAGHEVGAVARGGRLEQLRRDGVVLLDEATGRKIRARIKAAASLDPDGDWDAVLIAVRNEQLAEAARELAADRACRLYVSMTNAADGGAALAAAIGVERTALGFPGIGGSRSPDGTVRYRLVPRFVQTTTFGERSGPPRPALAALASAVAAAGIPTAVSRSMEAWQRTHAALVCPLANAVYAAGSAAALGRDRRLIGLAIDASREGLAASRALGFAPEPPRLALAMATPKPLLAPLLGAALGSGTAESVVERHALAARAEMACLSAALLAELARSGAALPAMTELDRLARVAAQAALAPSAGAT